MVLSQRAKIVIQIMRIIKILNSDPSSIQMVPFMFSQQTKDIVYTWFWHCFRSIQSLLCALFPITDTSRFRWLVDIYIYFYMLRYINGIHITRRKKSSFDCCHTTINHSLTYKCAEISLNFMVSIISVGLACGMCLCQNILRKYSQLCSASFSYFIIASVFFIWFNLIQFDVINSIFIFPSSLNLLIESIFFGYFSFSFSFYTLGFCVHWFTISLRVLAYLRINHMSFHISCNKV